MNTSQNFRARVPPSRVPTGGAPIKHSSLIGSNRPEVLAGRANLLKSQQQAEANTNVPQYPAQSSEHENTKDKFSTTPEGIINNEDDRKIEPVLTSEEPEIKPKKQFSESRRAEDENEDEMDAAGNDEHTSQDLLTLSQSLKAMKSLRDNFKSFEYGMEEDTYNQNQAERVYREVDEEDYVKVESEEQTREYDEEEEADREADEEYEDEYPQDQEPDYRGSSRSVRDQYIEKIHEKSQREEDDEEEEVQPAEDDEPGPGSNTNVLADPEENLYIGQKSAQVSAAKNDPESAGLRYQEQEDIPPPRARQVEKSPIVKAVTPKLDKSAGLRYQEQEDVPPQMARQVEKSPIVKAVTPKLDKSAGLRYQEQEDIPPPMARQVEKSPIVKAVTPKLDKSAGLRHQGQEDIPPQIARQVEKSPIVKEATPKLNKETTPKNNVENEKNRFLDELEYGDIRSPQVVQEELPPPIPKPTGSHMPSPFGKMPVANPKTQAGKAEVGRKPNEGPFGARQPFVPSVRQEESNVSVQSPFRESAIEPVRQHHQQHSSESNDNTYLIRLKQVEIELAKEKKKNECLESERESLLTESKSLKQENAEFKANIDDLKRNRDIEKLAQKEQDAIGKLREELKSTVENSRLIAEHSNRVIDENVKYKQEMEGIVTTLESERDRLQQNINELNIQLRDERLKIENLQQRAESFERKAQEYEESFDLIQKQLKERMEAFQKLVSLNDDAQATLQSLPKVEELLAKLQPRNQTTSVQTSQVFSPPKAVLRTMKDDYPSFEVKAAFNKSESSTHKSQSDENIIRNSQQTAEPMLRKSQQKIEPLILNSQLTEIPSNKKSNFKPKTPFVNAESAISLDQTIQKNNSGLRSEKNNSMKSDTDFVFSPNFNQSYSKLTSSVLTDEPREEGKKSYRPFDVDEDLSLLVGNQTLLEMVATPQTAKPAKKDPFKAEGIHAQKDKSSDVESPIIRREVAQEAMIKKSAQIRPNFSSKTTPKSSSIKKEVTREEVLHSPQNLEDTMRHRNPMTEHSGDWGLEDSLVSASSLNKSAQPQETEKEKKPVLPSTKQLEVTTQPKTITFAHAEPSPKIETTKIETPKTTVQENKPEPVALKPVFSLPPGKSKVPSFVKQPSIDETKTKELILGRTVSGSQEKSSATSEKPGFGSSQNKGGLRYAQPKKNIDKNLISVEADNFFDELGLSDVSVGKGANALRESATSLRSNASRQSQTVVKKKN